jgi:hypothetical protein
MTAPYTSAEIISLTNLTRQSEGLPPLHPNPLLMSAAQNKASAMLAAGSWSHNTPDATSWQFLDQVGYRYQIAGENLARNYQDSTDVINAWINSPTHKNNLLNPNYTQIGVAVATGSADQHTSTLVVQYLGTPLTTQTTSNDSQFNATIMLNFSSASPNYLQLGLFTAAMVSTIFLAKLIGRNKKAKAVKSNSPHPKHWRT